MATGQMGYENYINLWDSKSMETIKIITGDIKRGIRHVAFSVSGKLLMATGINDDHDFAVYSLDDIKNPRLVLL